MPPHCVGRCWAHIAPAAASALADEPAAALPSLAGRSTAGNPTPDRRRPLLFLRPQAAASRFFAPRRGREEPGGAPSAGGARRAEGFIFARLRARSGGLAR